jgi:hypothetical protein
MQLCMHAFESQSSPHPYASWSYAWSPPITAAVADQIRNCACMPAVHKGHSAVACLLKIIKPGHDQDQLDHVLRYFWCTTSLLLILVVLTHQFVRNYVTHAALRAAIGDRAINIAAERRWLQCSNNASARTNLCDMFKTRPTIEPSFLIFYQHVDITCTFGHQFVSPITGHCSLSLTASLGRFAT